MNKENNSFHPSPCQSDRWGDKKYLYTSITRQSITIRSNNLWRRHRKTFYCLTWPRQMTKVNLHINRQTLEIREATRDYSIMHEISMWGITTIPPPKCVDNTTSSSTTHFTERMFLYNYTDSASTSLARVKRHRNSFCILV